MVKPPMVDDVTNAMRRILICFFLIFPTAVEAAPPLALKRVLLSTGGVGYFEHEAVVEGDAELELEVRLDQVDDVLKSIVVYDDTGRVGAVRLPGRRPLAQAFRDLPFGRDALASPAKLLQSLQGVEIEAGGTRGRLISVTAEPMAMADGKVVVPRHRVTVNTPGGLSGFILEDAGRVRFVDPKLAGQVSHALEAVARHRVRGRRRLRIAVTGGGRRRVRVAYVVGAPLWKASYRLTVGRGAKGTNGHLQGWAVVENMSGRDWRGVELTLVSGNPVTFRQAIYTSYYVHRPEVPVEVLGRVLPPPDPGILADAAPVAAPEPKQGRLEKSKRWRAQNFSGRRADRRFVARDSVASESAMAANQMARLAAASSRESTTQVLFRLPRKVSIEAGNSLVVPIVDRPIPARRVAHFQPATHASHPLASVRLTNAAKTGLPAGVMTLYESAKSGVAHLGDARLGTLPPGEERLVSFALDEKTRIDAHTSTAERIVSGTLRHGVFHYRVTDQTTATYQLRAPRRAARQVVLEHPRQTGWKMTAPKDVKVALAPGSFRAEMSLKAGETRKLALMLSRPRNEKIRLSTLGLDAVAAFAKANALDDKVREAFRRMARIMKTIRGHKARETQLTATQRSLFQDQKRIRENMRRLSSNSRLYKRYSAKLIEQEDRLDDIAGKIEAARKARAKAAAELADYIATLDS